MFKTHLTHFVVILRQLPEFRAAFMTTVSVSGLFGHEFHARHFRTIVEAFYNIFLRFLQTLRFSTTIVYSLVPIVSIVISILLIFFAFIMSV